MFSVLKPHKKRLFVTLVFLFISVLLNLPIPLISKYLIDTIIPDGRKDLLDIYCVGVFVVFLLLIGNNLYLNYNIARIRELILSKVRILLFNKIHNLPSMHFKNTGSGYMLSRINNDPDVAFGFITEGLIQLVRNMLTFIFGLMLLFYLHWKMALLSLTIIPIYIYSTIYFNPKIREQTESIQEKFAQLANFTNESFSLSELIKSFSGEKREAIKYYEKYRILIKAIIKRFFTNSFLNSSISFSTMLGPLILLWYGGNEMIDGKLTLGSYVAFSGYIGYLYSPINNFMNFNSQYQAAKVAYNRISEILEYEEEFRGGTIKLKEFKNIIFNNISFSYEDKLVLKKININIPKGKFISIIGASGVGKTTLVNMLLGFNEYKKGKILINNIDFTKYNLKSIRNKISIVHQDSMLFSGTIYKNIKYGNPSANKSNIIDAAKKARAHQFIINLENGYDTFVGNRGSKLSGGQKQRLAIARAIIKNPQIFILDEATSSLDSENEKYIHDMLMLLKNEGKTILTISHRLSIVINSDYIYLLNDGMIKESGEHNELIKKNGLYKKIYDKQFNS